MATAIEKLTEVVNRSSPFWTKDIRVVAKRGKIEVVYCEGVTYSSDPPEKKKT